MFNGISGSGLKGSSNGTAGLAGSSQVVSRQVESTPNTRLSPLELMPTELKKLVSTHLRKHELIALGQTSKAMQRLTGLLEHEAKILATQVDTLLQKPHGERKLEDLVRIGLLPRESLTPKYKFSARKLAVLLSDNVIKGLQLNKDNGVQVDLKAFSHVPSDRMPRVVGGVSKLHYSSRGIFSDGNREKIRLKNGDRVTILSEIAKSNVFVNALYNERISMFDECLSNFNITGDYLYADLGLAKQWARAVHPDVYRFRFLPSSCLIRAGAFVGLAGFSSLFAAAGTHKEIVDVLLENKANFNITKADGETPLFIATRAVRRDTEAIIPTLIQHGIDVNHADELGKTALHWAVKFMYPNKVALLIQHGANVNHLNRRGQNALHLMFAENVFCTSTQRMIITIQHLLDAGINVFQMDHAGKRPVDYLRENARRDPYPRAVIKLVEDAMREHRPRSV